MFLDDFELVQDSNLLSFFLLSAKQRVWKNDFLILERAALPIAFFRIKPQVYESNHSQAYDEPIRFQEAVVSFKIFRNRLHSSGQKTNLSVNKIFIWGHSTAFCNLNLACVSTGMKALFFNNRSFLRVTYK